MARLLRGSLLLVVLACSEPIDPDTPGSIKITVSTTGEEIDPDGYTLFGFQRRVASNGFILLDNLTPDAIIDLRLTDIAPNCSYTGPVGTRSGCSPAGRTS